MGTAIIRGDAVDKSRILKVVPANVEVGDVFRLGVPDFVHDRFVEYEAAEATVHDVVTGLADAIAGSDLAEFGDLTAAGVDDDDDGEFEWLQVTGPAGEHFEMSGQTENTSAGNITVTENTAGDSGSDEVQKVALKGSPTGGTFKLEWDPGTGTETTGSINFDADAAAVQTALEGLASVSPGDVKVTGGPGPDKSWFVQFTGTYAQTDVALLNVDGTNLTGAAAVEIETATEGSPAADHVVVVEHEADAGDFTLTVNGETTGSLAMDSSDSDLQTSLEGLGTVGAGNVEVFGEYGQDDAAASERRGLWLVHFKGDLAGQSLTVEGDGSGLSTGSLSVGIVSGGGSSTRDEIQFFDLDGPTGGTFRLAYDGEVTDAIAFDADEATVKSELEKLTGITDVTVRQGPSAVGFFYLEFFGADSDTDKSQVQLNASGLSGASGATDGTVQNGGGNVDEVQHVRVFASGGDFTLTFDGQTTGSIAFGAAAGTVETALEGLSNITDVTVSGTGTDDDPYVVTFVDPGDQDVPQMTGDASGLTGGGGEVTVNTDASSAVNEVQDVVLDSTVSGGDFTLTFDGETTAKIAYNASAGTVETELEALASIDGVSVASITDGWRITFDTGNVAALDVALLEADGDNLSGGSGNESLTITEHQRGGGRNFFDDPTNWVRGQIPDAMDDLTLQEGETDLLYGLRQRLDFTVDTAADTLQFSETPDFRNDQKLRVTTTGSLPGGLAADTNYYVINLDRDAGTLQLATSKGGSAIDLTSSGSGTHTIGLRLNSFVRTSQWTGRIGLPDRREDGSWEYLAKALAIGLAAAGEKTLRFGDGDGPGSSLNRIDVGPDEWNLMVLDSGSGTTGLPALQLTGDNANNTQTILEGEVGFAFFAGETTSLKGLTMRGGRVQLGAGVSLSGTIDRSDGELISRGADITSAVFEWN